MSHSAHDKAYSAGHPQAPQETDNAFDTREQAEGYATGPVSYDDLVGVWQNETGELLSIGFEGRLYVCE